MSEQPADLSERVRQLESSLHSLYFLIALAIGALSAWYVLKSHD